MPLADDYPEITLFRDGAYFKTYGVWRILGHATPFFSMKLSPYLPSILALAFQVMATVCLFELFRRLLSEHIAVTLGIVFGVFPWGFEAVLWCSSLQVVIVTILFLANLLVLLTGKSPLMTFVLSFLISFVSYFVNDYLLFATMVSGIVLWPKHTRYAMVAPILSGGSYLVLYEYFSRALLAPYKKQPSILSVCSLSISTSIRMRGSSPHCSKVGRELC